MNLLSLFSRCTAARWLAFCALFVLLAGCTVGNGSAPAPADDAALNPPGNVEQAAVVDVIDGDTVDVLLNGEEVRLRLIGMDTPETVHPSRPVECFGREASEQARELLDSKTVQLEVDESQSRRDRFGRQLRYIWLPDGRLFNLEMIRQGYAFEYTYNVPYKYQAEFQQAQETAREEQRGLWSPDACEGERRPADATPQLSPAVSPTPAAEACDPSYPDVCIPSPPPDLDCRDIEERLFTVLPPDPHNFDGNGDGVGCAGR